MKTAEGGEIFNAEYDNTAGGKCFSIVELILPVSSTVVDLNTITITNNVALDIENDKIMDAQGPGRAGTCPWKLFSFEVPAGKYIVNNLAPENLDSPIFQDCGFYMGINSTQNSELLFIDSEAFSFTAPDSTNTIHIFYGSRGDFGKTYDPYDPKGDSYPPFGSITNFSVSKTSLAAYKLDDIEGIEIGDIYSLKIGANYDFYGKVTHLDTNNNIVTVSNFTKGTTTDLSDAVMWFPYKPQIGTQVNGGAEHAEGYATTAINWGSHSEGFNTLAEGKYSHTENRSTVAGYASHAEGQETYALGQWSHTQGFATAVFGDYGFAFGRGLYPITNYFNKLHKNITAEELKEKWIAANRKFLAVYGSESTSGGKNNLVLGKNSFAIGEENLIEGNNSKALGAYSVVSGNNSTDIGHGNNNNGDKNFSAGTGNTIYGINSTVIGYNNGIDKNNWTSMLITPDGEGIENGISNNYFNNLYIEGKENKIISTQDGWPISDDVAYLDNLHIEGIKNRIDIHLCSKIKNTHIEGCNNLFIGNDIINSHFEGVGTSFSDTLSTERMGEPPLIEASHVEGYCNNIKGHIYQTHIEGANNKVGEANADGTYKNKVISSHIEGQNNTVKSSNYAHIQGASNKVESSNGGHVGGWNNTVKGNCAFAHGHGLIAKGLCSIAVGKWNVESDANSKSLDTAQFTVGIGTDTNNRKNAFCVLRNGNVTAAGTYQTSGADYSELFEWIDGNINNEDRRGYFVTLDGDKIRIANSEDDYILGIVSATPSVLGDSYFGSNWHGKYLTDIFGTIITKTIHVEEKPICIKEEYIDKRVLEDGTVKEYIEPAQYEIIPAHDETIPVINPDYDPEREYIDRLNRQEWTPIGMMGKLVVIDDGTCKVNGYCKVSSNGIATNSENGYRVMSRLDDTHIRILFK